MSQLLVALSQTRQSSTTIALPTVLYLPMTRWMPNDALQKVYISSGFISHLIFFFISSLFIFFISLSFFLLNVHDSPKNFRFIHMYRVLDTVTLSRVHVHHLRPIHISSSSSFTPASSSSSTICLNHGIILIIIFLWFTTHHPFPFTHRLVHWHLPCSSWTESFPHTSICTRIKPYIHTHDLLFCMQSLDTLLCFDNFGTSFSWFLTFAIPGGNFGFRI